MRICAANVIVGICGLLVGIPLVACGQDPEPTLPRRAAYFVPGPPLTSGQLREKVSGLCLPAGFRQEASPDSPTGQVGGSITGPGELEIIFYVSPTGAHRLGPKQVYFESEAQRLKEGEHQWARDQYIGDERVQLVLAKDNTLVVSYPERGVNMIAHVEGLGQLSDALLVMLSVPNKDRRLSWEDAKKLIKNEDVESILKLHTGQLTIHLADGTTCYAQEAAGEDVISYVRKIGKAGKIGIALD